MSEAKCEGQWDVANDNIQSEARSRAVQKEECQRKGYEEALRGDALLMRVPESD